MRYWRDISISFSIQTTISWWIRRRWLQLCWLDTHWISKLLKKQLIIANSYSHFSYYILDLPSRFTILYKNYTSVRFIRIFVSIFYVFSCATISMKCVGLCCHAKNSNHSSHSVPNHLYRLQLKNMHHKLTLRTHSENQESISALKFDTSFKCFEDIRFVHFPPPFLSTFLPPLSDSGRFQTNVQWIESKQPM